MAMRARLTWRATSRPAARARTSSLAAPATTSSTGSEAATSVSARRARTRFATASGRDCDHTARWREGLRWPGKRRRGEIVPVDLEKQAVNRAVWSAGKWDRVADYVAETGPKLLDAVGI